MITLLYGLRGWCKMSLTISYTGQIRTYIIYPGGWAKRKNNTIGDGQFRWRYDLFPLHSAGCCMLLVNLPLGPSGETIRPLGHVWTSYEPPKHGLHGIFIFLDLFDSAGNLGRADPKYVSLDFLTEHQHNLLPLMPGMGQECCNQSSNHTCRKGSCTI